ncbi:response regulator transcription factor [Metabacillus halosaccharovorans]|uniref:response regulator transcription factor n=1 Tax=Metabacillus halosaccharovorans TaxID=930124 RepID=UPI002041ECA2|nr:response regulator [Metabacillus halosaccharovorans]MCM3444104.1 response regulator [Metabacillus halosaccharovorans]
MYKVMIVDDEPIIRFGLKSSINWERENLFLLGDFSNGKQALEAIEAAGQVDILITDIKMPVMDGLTLMKKALKINPMLKVVLVSSYNEFDYAREGLTHGAMDYILKPTLEPESFCKTIQKCVKKIVEEQTIKKKLDSVERTNHFRERKKIEQEVKRVLLQKHRETNIGHLVDMFQTPFIVVCLKMKQIDKVEEEYGFLFKSLIFEEIQERFYKDREEGISIQIGESELLFFIKNTCNPLTDIHRLKEKVEKETMVSFSFGYEVVTDCKGLVTGYERSVLASQRHFFNQHTNIFVYKHPVEEFVHPLSLQELKELLTNIDVENVPIFLGERLKQWRSEQMTPTDIKKEACDILTTLFMERIEYSFLIDRCSEIERSESLNDLNEYLLKGFEACDQYITNQKMKSNTDNELIDKALDFIHKHYTQELTLQHVADHIHISRNYFSILFKRFLGQNFIDYVIDLRIKKARELLVHTSLKVYEVAGNAGFNDVKYFSKLFKKVTGSSPGDFRMQHQK